MDVLDIIDDLCMYLLVTCVCRSACIDLFTRGFACIIVGNLCVCSSIHVIKLVCEVIMCCRFIDVLTYVGIYIFVHVPCCFIQLFCVVLGIASSTDGVYSRIHSCIDLLIVVCIGLLIFVCIRCYLIICLLRDRLFFVCCYFVHELPE